MEQKRKLTVRLPAALLARAQAATGKGISETLRMALEMVIGTGTSKKQRRLRGKVTLSPAIERKTKRLTAEQKAALARTRERAELGWTTDGKRFDRASLHER